MMVALKDKRERTEKDGETYESRERERWSDMAYSSSGV